MWEWLIGPIDPFRAHDVQPFLSWHARSMVLAWAIAVPIGIIAARFFKVLPWQNWPREVDNRLWWNTHRVAQYSALVLMAAGLVLALADYHEAASLTATAWVHRLVGYAALSAGAGQCLSAWLRGTKGGPTDPRGSIRGDHYDMTRRRLAFERFHKRVGYVAFALATAAISTGLWQANGPRWIWLLLLVWWASLAIVVVLLSKRGSPVSTYAAIWGADPNHPGNRGLKR